MSKEIDIDRVVVVASSHGEKFCGMVPGFASTDPAKYLKKNASERLPVTLKVCRLLLTQMGAGPGGIEAGISTMAALIPIDMADGPMSEVHVVPSSWYLANADPKITEDLTRMIKAAEKAELVNRANRAGLITAGEPRGQMVP